MMPLIEKKAGFGLAAMLSAIPSVAEGSSSQCAANDFPAQMSISFVSVFMVCLSVVIGLFLGLAIAAHEETTARLSGGS